MQGGHAEFTLFGAHLLGHHQSAAVAVIPRHQLVAHRFRPHLPSVERGVRLNAKPDLDGLAPQPLQRGQPDLLICLRRMAGLTVFTGCTNMPGGGTTSGGICQPGVEPCQSALNCDEDMDSCVVCTIHTDCDNGLYCDGIERCENGICEFGPEPCPSTLNCDEEADECRLATLTVSPDNLLQSSWIPLPLFLRIVGTGTHFDASSIITFNPDGAVIAFSFLGDEEHLFLIGLLMPAWLAPEQSLEITVTTDTEEVAETLDIMRFPFMLDGGKETKKIIEFLKI